MIRLAAFRSLIVVAAVTATVIKREYMRSLLLLLLCLFTTPSSASVFHLQGGSYQVTGDFGAHGIVGSVSASFSWTPVPGLPYDPFTGPFFGFFITVRVNDGQFQSCSFSQAESRCTRTLLNLPFDVFDFDGDGDGTMNISPVLQLTNVTISDFDIAITLPDGFAIVSPQVAAVPEPSTWAMLLIGFAGIGYLTYRRRHSPLIVARGCRP